MKTVQLTLVYLWCWVPWLNVTVLFRNTYQWIKLTNSKQISCMCAHRLYTFRQKYDDNTCNNYYYTSIIHPHIQMDEQVLLVSQACYFPLSCVFSFEEAFHWLFIVCVRESVSICCLCTQSTASIFD